MEIEEIKTEHPLRVFIDLIINKRILGVKYYFSHLTDEDELDSRLVDFQYDETTDTRSVLRYDDYTDELAYTRTTFNEYLTNYLSQAKDNFNNDIILRLFYSSRTENDSLVDKIIDYIKFLIERAETDAEVNQFPLIVTTLNEMIEELSEMHSTKYMEKIRTQNSLAFIPKKLQWRGRKNELMKVFRDLISTDVYQTKNGEPYIKASKSEIGIFISNNFVDSNNKSIKANANTEYLKPSKAGKLSKNRHELRLKLNRAGQKEK